MKEIVRIENTSVKLYGQPMDMRLSFPGMIKKIEKETGKAPSKETLYVFVNKAYKRVKCLYWDNNGWAMWYKYVANQGKIFKIENRDGYRRITGVNVRELLRRDTRSVEVEDAPRRISNG